MLRVWWDKKKKTILIAIVQISRIVVIDIFRKIGEASFLSFLADIQTENW